MPQPPAHSALPVWLRRALMLAGLGLALTPWITPPLALAMGMVLALAGLTAWDGAARRASRLLIQVSIVLLGFWISLEQVARAGVEGALFSAGLIVVTFSLGALLGRLLKTDARLTALLSSGTAICGGSAIAATGAVIRATSTQMSVALGLVFILNTVALYLFPFLGRWMGMSEHQFGAWAAVAVHDVANMLATARQFGPDALGDATVIKLTRVLWLAPVCVALGWWFSRPGAPAPADGGERPATRGRGARLLNIVPWFVLGFLLMSVARTLAQRWWPGVDFEPAAARVRSVSSALITAALFLIGCGLSPRAIASVGWRAMVQGVVLWVIVSAAALGVILAAVS